MLHRGHSLKGGRGAPANTQDDLEQGRRLDQPFLDQLLAEFDMAEVEDFELRFRPCRADTPCHLAKLTQRIHVDQLVEVQRADVQAAQLGPPDALPVSESRTWMCTIEAP